MRVGITSFDAFQVAFKEIGKRHDHLMIEETVPGTIYRLLCLTGRVIAVSYGIPANVSGDGTHSISELVAIKNASRGHHEIEIDRDARRLLTEAGYSPEDVPACGVRVFLGDKSNYSRGADHEDATDDVHPSYIAVAEKAVSAFSGLVLCGVDLAIEDATVPARDNYHVLELNSCPLLTIHYHPVRGKVRPVAEAIIDFLSGWDKTQEVHQNAQP